MSCDLCLSKSNNSSEKHTLFTSCLHCDENPILFLLDVFAVVMRMLVMSNVLCCVSQSGMNIEKQIVQLSQRRDRLVPKLDQILARVQSPSYLTKVPSHVREQMDSKVKETCSSFVCNCFTVSESASCFGERESKLREWHCCYRSLTNRWL